MKILFVCMSPPAPGGAGDSPIAFNRMRLLSERGHDISLVAYLGNRPETHPAGLADIVSHMELLPPPSSGGRLSRLRHVLVPFRGPLLARAFSMSMQKAVGRTVAVGHHDVAIAGSPMAGQFLYRNPNLPAVRRVICCQGALGAAGSPGGGARRGCTACDWVQRHLAGGFELGMYRFADRLITITMQERFDLLRRNPYLNVSVIPYGLDLQQAHEHAWSEGQAILLSGSASDGRYQQSVRWFLRRVWPQVRVRNPEQELIVDGYRGPLALYARARHAGGIRRADPSMDAEQLLAEAKLYVCPLRRAAGFQEKLLKAMAAGVPVVATSLGADSVGAQTGESIFLADTAHNMAESINLLLSDAGLRGRIAGHARRLVETRFSWERSVDKLEEVLRRVVK